MRRFAQEKRRNFIVGTADWLVRTSLFQARSWLKRNGSIRLLVDNSTLAHAVTHETAWISTGPEKWGGVHEFDSGYAARVPVHSKGNDSRTYHEIQYLVGIAQLAREQKLLCLRSAELEAERWRQPIGRFSGYGLFDLSLFDGIEMASVDGYFLDSSEPKLRQQDRLSRVTDRFFVDLVHILGPKANLDAFHIHTAETNGLFGFLTMDFRLANAVTNNAHREPIRSMRTQVFLPSQLGKMIGVPPIPPVLLSFQNATWFVRPDLYIEGERRRRPRPRSQ